MKNYEKEFPFTKTKVRGLNKNFDLDDIKERKKYFKEKVGKEINLLKKYFKNNSFIAYFLGKKISGKGTYTRLMIEIFGEDKISHISAGDVIRQAHQDMGDKKKKKELLDYLTKNYRGYISIDEAIKRLLGRSTKALLPTEFTLALIKKKIDQIGRKTLFIDGFPRDLDQVSYSLFFRDLINYRDDSDIFVAIDIPEYVIDQRMKGRVACPICQTPRGLELLVTKKVGYDENKKEFYLKCDNPGCKEKRMIKKEGDDLGIKPIRKRLDLDDQLIDRAFSLHGIPKILLRNSVPVSLSKTYVDNYEITPKHIHKWDIKNKKVITTKESWIAKDDKGKEVYSLLAPPVAISLIKQLTKVLSLVK